MKNVVSFVGLHEAKEEEDNFQCGGGWWCDCKVYSSLQYKYTILQYITCMHKLQDVT